MTAPARQKALEARIATLERRLAQTTDTIDREVCGFERRLRRIEQGASPQSGGLAGEGVEILVAAPGPTSAVSEQARSPVLPSAARTSSTLLSGMSFGDLVGGRVLAWLGGVATLLGIVLFLAMAISHGWIGEQARVVLAAAASAALMAGQGRWARSSQPDRQ